MNGIRRALDTKPGTSFDTVTSKLKIHHSISNLSSDDEEHGLIPLPQAIANARALSKVSSEVCRAEISSTSFFDHLMSGEESNKSNNSVPSQEQD
jgi:hypothetical protein